MYSCEPSLPLASTLLFRGHQFCCCIGSSGLAVGLALQDTIQNFAGDVIILLLKPFKVVAVAELADSSVNFTVRLWVEGTNYWPLKFDMNERIYNKFNEVGLNIPFPQMDVHVHKEG